MAKLTQKETLDKIVTTLDMKIGEDIQVIGIKDLTILADYFVIATGSSTTHARSLADEVEFQLKQVGIEPLRTEGYQGANWIILDYGDIVVHVFYKETREFYNLERLWSDGEQVDISHLLK